MELNTVIRMYLIGGYGGVRGPTEQETLKALAVHGAGKDEYLQKELAEILKESKENYEKKLRGVRANSEEIQELIRTTHRKIEVRIRVWKENKKAKKKGGKIALPKQPK